MTTELLNELITTNHAKECSRVGCQIDKGVYSLGFLSGMEAAKRYLESMILPTGGHAMTSVDIDQNGVSVR